jgi:hypothetical protein
VLIEIAEQCEATFRGSSCWPNGYRSVSCQPTARVSGQTLPALQRRSHASPRKGVAQRKQQSRYHRGGQETGGLFVGRGSPGKTLLRRRRISGGGLSAAPLTECMDVNRDLPGLAELGSQQLEETLGGCPQDVSRLAGNPNSIFGNGAFFLRMPPVTAHGCLVPRIAGTAAERHSRDFTAVLHGPKAALRARRWGNSVCPLTLLIMDDPFHLVRLLSRR